ncbi:uncharacterized protein LOC111173703 [Delphinapterus leucas]|uniref:Uncharacterized protein LOC111173703 n=1 Tax=Delphinapterus leucas TaxID=9749 RepID=A0A2Y9N709_DELLE|nr:uncharacterized protein LOC111173703 [Delphinapterus leucas]
MEALSERGEHRKGGQASGGKDKDTTFRFGDAEFEVPMRQKTYSRPRLARTGRKLRFLSAEGKVSDSAAAKSQLGGGGDSPGRGRAAGGGTRGRDTAPYFSKVVVQAGAAAGLGFGREERQPRLGARICTWQAGRPGRGGCERARPLRARSASRASRGRLRHQAPGEPAASVLPPAELCAAAAAAAAAAPSPTCWRRRDKEGEEGGGGGDRGGGASPLQPSAPTSRGLRSPCSRPVRAPRPRPGQASRPHGRRRGCSPFCPARPARPGRSHPEPPASLRRARGARRRLDAPGRRLGAPAQLNSPESAAAGSGGRAGRRGQPRETENQRARRSEPESERREQTPCRAGRRISPSACRRKSRREMRVPTLNPPARQNRLMEHWL